MITVKDYTKFFRLVILITGLKLAVLSASGQDIHWSQYNASPLNLNPALTGFYDGDYRFAANHRRQWKSVTTPYSTLSGSFDMVVNGSSASRNRYNAGLLVNNDRAGDSELGLFQAMLSLSAIRAVGADSIHFIGVGLQGGFARRSISYANLNFDEQYNGDAFDASSGNTETGAGESHSYADFGAGISWLVKASDRFKAGAGVSVQHINKPNDSFFEENVEVLPHLQADVKADFAIAKKFDMIPSVLFMSQGSFRELTGGSSFRYRFSELPGREYAFYLGGYVRTRDAFFASAGVGYNNLNIGVSYDFNTSDLSRASDGRGGYELSLIYIIRKVRQLGIRPPCPLY